MFDSSCSMWADGDAIMKEYHDNEWCKINHDDNFQFEMLCLEGASTGLSWKIIMHKRVLLTVQLFINSISTSVQR